MANIYLHKQQDNSKRVMMITFSCLLKRILRVALRIQFIVMMAERFLHEWH